MAVEALSARVIVAHWSVASAAADMLQRGMGKKAGAPADSKKDGHDITAHLCNN